MDSFDKRLCRTCMFEAKKNQKLYHIYDFPTDNWCENIATLLVRCTPQLHIRLDDKLPKNICMECLDCLKKLANFQNMCLETQRKLLQLLDSEDMVQPLPISDPLECTTTILKSKDSLQDKDCIVKNENLYDHIFDFNEGEMNVEIDVDAAIKEENTDTPAKDTKRDRTTSKSTCKADKKLLVPIEAARRDSPNMFPDLIDHSDEENVPDIDYIADHSDEEQVIDKDYKAAMSPRPFKRRTRHYVNKTKNLTDHSDEENVLDKDHNSDHSDEKQVLDKDYKADSSKRPWKGRRHKGKNSKSPIEAASLHCTQVMSSQEMFPDLKYHSDEENVLDLDYTPNHSDVLDKDYKAESATRPFKRGTRNNSNKTKDPVDHADEEIVLDKDHKSDHNDKDQVLNKDYKAESSHRPFKRPRRKEENPKIPIEAASFPDLIHYSDEKDVPDLEYTPDHSDEEQVMDRDYKAKVSPRLLKRPKGEIPKIPIEAASFNYCTIVMSSPEMFPDLKDYSDEEHVLDKDYKAESSPSRSPIEEYPMIRRKRPTPRKIHKCEFCKKAFCRSWALERHKRKHNEEQGYLCSECGKSFRLRQSMVNHMKRHSDKRPYECPQCPKRFPCAGDIHKHLLKHNKLKRYKCDTCSAAFITTTELKIHKMRHNGDRPFHCSYCDKRFSAPDNLRRHERTHTGEKPYKCQYCTMAYAQSNDLVKHLRNHLGENVYICELCPQRFRLSSIRREHFKSHKNEDEATRARNLKALQEEQMKLKAELTI